MRRVEVAAAAALAVVCGLASAAPTQNEITRARERCHAGKMHVTMLEEQLSAEDPKLRQARTDWEASCVKAQALMDERDGKPILQAEQPG